MAFATSRVGFNDPRVRRFLYQALLIGFIVALVGGATYNAYSNMRARGIPMGFAFWDQVAGFEINLHLIEYSALSTYGRAFWVGLLNTFLVVVIAVPLATLLGFAVGVSRLSPNWLLSRLALAYTTVFRNTPLLLQLLFWYNAVLKSLPAPRQSLSLGGVIFLNNRGVFLPAPSLRPSAIWFLAAIGLAALLSTGVSIWARRRRDRTGFQTPVLTIALALVIGLPAIVVAVMGAPFELEVARLSGFNLKGGLQAPPEMAALIFGLVVFSAAFIAEVVRAGIQAVPRGQVEAASALGLHRDLSTRLVVVPQAMRLIVPPLTSQYLNIVKNSSLAVFIGYPDLVQIFAGTVLNQTQAAVQVMAITMGVYLAISLAVAALLNVYNARHSRQEGAAWTRR